MITVRLISISFLFLIALACSPTFGWGESGGLSGTWSGAWQEGGMSGSLVFRFTQEGESVRGTYDSGGGGRRGSLRGVRVYGTLKGDHLILKTYDDQRGFDGKVNGNTISGTYWGKFATKGFDVKRTEK